MGRGWKRIALDADTAPVPYPTESHQGTAPRVGDRPHELRLRAARTDCGRAQVGILRERLLKLGAYVVVSVRRVVIHLPVSFPFLSSFRQIALSFGALSG